MTSKKILYTDFETTESLVASMLNSPEMKKALMRNNLYKFWNKVVGKKFGEKSKPYSMMGGGVMVIACESAAVAQELSLQKFQIIEKFKPYVKSLKLNLKDIRFDVKKWEKD